MLDNLKNKSKKYLKKSIIIKNFLGLYQKFKYSKKALKAYGYLLRIKNLTSFKRIQTTLKEKNITKVEKLNQTTLKEKNITKVEKLNQKSDYLLIDKYVKGKGGSNKDGRLSRNFFGMDGEKINSNRKNLKNPSWQLNHKSSSVLFESYGLEFSINTKNSNELSNNLISLKVDKNLSLIKNNKIDFNIKMKDFINDQTSNKYISLIINYYDQNDTKRTEKIDLITSDKKNGISIHSILLKKEKEEKYFDINFYISRKFKINFVLQNFQIDEIPLSVPKKIIKSIKEENNISRNYIFGNNKDLSFLADEEIDMIAGCEVSYLSEYIKKLGLKVRHSYALHLAMDPYSELINDESIYYTGEAKNIIFSQIQIIRPIIYKMIDEVFNEERDEEHFILDTIIENLKECINKLKLRRNIRVWLLSFPYPSYSYNLLGTHQYINKSDQLTIFEFLTLYRLALYKIAREFDEVYVLDVDHALESEGKNPKEMPSRVRLHEIQGGHLEKPGAEILGEYFLYQLKILSKTRNSIKAIVVDCDNTLWDGIIREDGEEGVKIRRTYFQRLWQLSQRGIPIILCSKNDPEDEEIILRLIRSYSNLYKSIVISKINWLPKSKNIKSIISELNLGINSIAVFDDSEFEREEISTAIPGINVFKDKEILNAPEMEIFQPTNKFTNESKDRIKKYKEEKNRSRFEKSFVSENKSNFEAFLYACEMRIEIRLAEQKELNRVVETLTRTNQLNATLKRMTFDEVKEFFQDKYKNIHIFKLGDKFGDYGIIGVTLSTIKGKFLHLDELALSCRAMGRKIEEAFLQEIIGFANDNNLDAITIDIVKTSRNKSIIDILTQVGFVSSNNNLLVLNLEKIHKGRDFAKWLSFDQKIIDND